MLKKINNPGKNGQLKIQQMSFMLMAIVLFFILAGLFFLAIKVRDIEGKATNLEKEKALSTVEKISETAEFSCGKPDCIDTDKIMALTNRKAYNEFWPVASIKIRKLYPEDEDIIVCDIDSYPNCNLFEVYSKDLANERVVGNYVALCRKESFEKYGYDKCELGQILVGFEQK